MIKWEFDNLQNLGAADGVTEQEWSARAGQIPELWKAIESRDQDFYRVIDDAEIVGRLEEFARSVRGRYDFVVVLGIGGSALGVSCLDQFLRSEGGSGGQRPGEKSGAPKLLVMDNIDPVFLAEAEAQLKLERTLFLVITKSGGTPETLAQFLYFKQKTEAAGLKLAEHFVMVTDPAKGPLREFVTSHPEITSFEVPEKVGGRFSVLTEVGLLPAALLGINIRQLLEGAKAGREIFRSPEFAQNVAFRIALSQFILYGKGKSMTVLFPYAQKLLKLADWYRQLLAESIGKAVNDRGEKVHIGITPVTALGATDQHSQNQLYNEGPNDKLFIFLKVAHPAVDLEIPADAHFEKELGYLKGVTFDQLLKTEMQGTLEALTEVKRPCISLEIERLDEFNLGEIFMILEGSIAFLGELFGINAYNQPGVELSKILTKKLLSK
jgi:glucose-6-phosphate isomerase